jgi:glycyl-tRNA synthetase alpha subunit
MYHVELNEVEEVATKVVKETHVDFEDIFVAQEEEVTRTIISVATVDSVPTKLKIVETESMMELQSQQMEVQICHR